MNQFGSYANAISILDARIRNTTSTREVKTLESVKRQIQAALDYEVKTYEQAEAEHVSCRRDSLNNERAY